MKSFLTLFIKQAFNFLGWLVHSRIPLLSVVALVAYAGYTKHKFEVAESKGVREQCIKSREYLKPIFDHSLSERSASEQCLYVKPMNIEIFYACEMMRSDDCSYIEGVSDPIGSLAE